MPAPAAACTRRPHLVIPIHSHDVKRLCHCARVGYQNLVSVPVRLQQRVIGEIDLFFRSEVMLAAGDQLICSIAGHCHLASALEGLRAEALEREGSWSRSALLLARELQ